MVVGTITDWETLISGPHFDDVSGYMLDIFEIFIASIR